MRLRFAMLGDSVASGQGASRPEDTIGARLVADLDEAGTPVDLRVFAVPGARSQDLAGQVTRAVAWRPALALIIIGANDLTHLVPPEQAATDLAVAVSALRAAGAEVVVAPAPDLSVVPWVPHRLRASIRAGSQVLQEAQTRAASRAGARVTRTGAETAAAFAADPSLFCRDRFHPSSAGYAVITATIAPFIRAAAATASGAGGASGGPVSGGTGG